MFDNSQKLKEKALELMEINREKFSHDKMTEALGEILENFMKDKPIPVSLKMPKLETVPPLPKLEKVGEIDAAQ